MGFSYKEKLSVVYGILCAKIFKKRTPLFIGWRITNRCNSRCKYCDVWEREEEELATRKIFAIIDELKELGTIAITFDGGEPLVRDDIGEIINYCKSKGFIVVINTNGTFVHKRINEIKGINYLKISIDGPPQIHDFIRGIGSYKEAVAAITIAKENGINIRLNTTLTRYNLRYIDFILDMAKEWGLRVKFQPVRDAEVLLPQIEEYRKAIKKIIFEKIRASKLIVNSLSGLRYIYSWPDVGSLRCYAGVLFCRISPGGNLYPCNIMQKCTGRINCKEHSFEDSFKAMPRNYPCSGCWCTTSLELNYFLSLNVDSLTNIHNIIISRVS